MAKRKQKKLQWDKKTNKELRGGFAAGIKEKPIKVKPLISVQSGKAHKAGVVSFKDTL